MSNIINFNDQVNLSQSKDLILNSRKTRFHLVGEPGIGKTSIVKALREATGYSSATMSVPDMDLGDVSMPIIHHESKTTRYYPNARFLMHLDKPVIICLDEYTKGNDPVKNMLHPLFDTFEPRLGDIMVHPESIIFSTGNLESDGVGDSMKAHTRMRLCVMPVAKPSAEQWKIWASENGIHPVIIAWADRYQHAFASYTDGDQEGNEFIFNPRHQRDGYVTPRTLEQASNIIHNKDGYDNHSLRVALAGQIGKSAAESVASFIRHHDSLPSWASLISDPDRADMPTDPGALAVMVFSSIERIQDSKELDSLLTYLKRADEEWQSIFCIGLAKNPAKSAIAFANKSFAGWVALNEDLL